MVALFRSTRFDSVRKSLCWFVQTPIIKVKINIIALIDAYWFISLIPSSLITNLNHFY